MTTHLAPPASDSEHDTVDHRSKEAPARPTHLQVVVGAATHPGKVRDRNEDHFLVATLCKRLKIDATSLPQGEGDIHSAEKGHLLIVADGMGGAAAGERASALAVESVERFFLDSVEWFLHLPGGSESLLVRELREGIQRTDRTLIERAEADYRLAGMGTTLTLAFVAGSDLFIVHAGDSRAYLFREGELEQVTRDHTLVQMMVETGMLSPEEARTHRKRNVITNVLGGPAQGVEAEIHKIPLQDGDIILLCSDGLSEPVTHQAITQTLARNSNDPDAACRRLVDQALEGGGPDNVTAVVARFSADD